MNWSNSTGAEAPAAISESMAALSFALVDAMLIILWWRGNVALLQGLLVCLCLAYIGSSLPPRVLAGAVCKRSGPQGDLTGRHVDDGSRGLKMKKAAQSSLHRLINKDKLLLAYFCACITRSLSCYAGGCVGVATFNASKSVGNVITLFSPRFMKYYLLTYIRAVTTHIPHIF